MKKVNLVVAQSGGPTAVINQSLVGVVRAGRRAKNVDKIYGARLGILGIIAEDFVDLKKVKAAVLEKVARTPSSALGSCRHKPSEEDCRKIFEVFKKRAVNYFFFIGGNDSAEGADIINGLAKKEGVEFATFHIPKTIDNDLCETDHCPGYGSAGRYVALSFMGNDLDNRSLPGIKIDVVMGRGAGWLTAAAALGRQSKDDGPHLLYFPEHPITLDKFTSDIKAVYERLGRCLVAVSEGARGPDGKVLLESQIKEKDAFGNIQLSGSGGLGDFLSAEVKRRLGEKLRVRSDTLGYSQRSFPTVVSEVDSREARMVGEAAVKFALKGCAGGSVIIVRGKGKRYSSSVGLVELPKVAKVTKSLPKEFINAEGNDVTKAFLDYGRPLVGKLPEMGRL